jgi:hypothetical protein
MKQWLLFLMMSIITSSICVESALAQTTAATEQTTTPIKHLIVVVGENHTFDTRLGRLSFEGVYALSSYAGMTTSNTSSHDLPAANNCLISSSKDRMTSRPIARHFCP